MEAHNFNPYPTVSVPGAASVQAALCLCLSEEAMPRVARCAQLVLVCMLLFVALAAAQLPSASATPHRPPAAPLSGDPSGAPMLPATERRPLVGMHEARSFMAPAAPPLTMIETRDDLLRTARAEQVPVASIPGAGPRMAGTLVAQTARLDFYVGAHTFSDAQIARLAAQIEAMLRMDEARFHTTLDHRVSLGFYRTASASIKGVRGLAYTDEHRTELFYDSGEDIQRAATVVAHELGHHLEAQRYGDDAQRRADTILHEGLATWVVGERWFAKYGATSWRDRARQIKAEGLPRQLLTAEAACGSNNAYELWASFTDFLIQRYGWETFDALYRSGRGRAPGSSDYEGVLGKSLNDLAGEWRAWVDE